MKKIKLFPIILSVAISCAIGASACTPKGLEAHTYATWWSSNINAHWHKCLNAGCNGRSEYEDHDWVLTDTYDAATCGENGWGQYTCSVCKATLGNRNTPAVIPATGDHDYQLDFIDVEPSCGEEGYGSYICSVCYDYTVAPIEPTGEHDYTGNYQSNKEGHYHVCRNGCGASEEIQPHIKDGGTRRDPVGLQDGKTEYRCTECDYLIETEVIESPNVPKTLSVKFVKVGGGAFVAPEERDDGELYAKLSPSSNASGGYTVELTGYTATGNAVAISGNDYSVSLYYYNEYTGTKSVLDLAHSGIQSTGYLGYINDWFYVARNISGDSTSLWIDCTPRGHATISIKVHITTV